MKKYTVAFSDEAINDLNNIYQYIYTDLSSPITAEKIYYQLKASINSLVIIRERIKILGTNKYLKVDIRRILSGKFSIFFIVDKANSSTIITNILYTSTITENKLKDIILSMLDVFP